MDEAAIGELLAKQTITEILHKYCRAMDRMDNDLGRSVFHPDAAADYGSMYRGTGYGFIEFVYGAHAGMLVHHHQLGNILIKVAGERAYSESYVTVTFRLRDAQGKLLGMASYGRYIDRWEKRDGCWAISDRRYLHSMDETRPIADDQYPPLWNARQSRPQLPDLGRLRFTSFRIWPYRRFGRSGSPAHRSPTARCGLDRRPTCRSRDSRGPAHPPPPRPEQAHQA